MVKKDFFVQRNPEEIEALDCNVVDTPENLVGEIEGIEDPNRQAVILDCGEDDLLVHPAFANIRNPVYRSRVTTRGIKRKGKQRREYPSYVQLEQPRSIENAIGLHRSENFPVNIRNKAFFESMAHLPEHENFHVGYMIRPIVGEDKSPMLVPFNAVADGAILDSYSERIKSNLPFDCGSKVIHVYGSDVYVKVPSEEQGKGRYTVLWENVPIRGMNKSKRELKESERELTESDRRAVLGWSTSPAYGIIKDGEFRGSLDAMPGNLQTHVSHEGSHRVGQAFKFKLMDNHSVASHREMVRHFMRGNDWRPMEMSQIANVSKADSAFYNRVRNNFLIMTRDKNGNPIFSQPREDQEAMLIARRVGNYIKELKEGEIQETMYWDPVRDGSVMGYSVLPGEK